MPKFNFVGASIKIISALLLIVLLASSQLLAHVVLVEPLPRSSSDNLTEDPCGGLPAGASVATYTAGTDIEITVNLSVQHNRSLQAVISYDQFNTRSPLAMIVTSGSGIYTMTVPLPKQPLGSAVLQVNHGKYVSCADITLAEGAPFEINAGLNDAWYDPATPGQGFLTAVFPGIRQIFLAWFTFDIERPPANVTATLGEPGHRWLTAQGPYDGNTANLTVYLTEGGVFDSVDPAASTNPEGVGTITLEFADCEEGLVTYEIDSLGISGEIPIERIVPDNVPLCEALIDP